MSTKGRPSPATAAAVRRRCPSTRTRRRSLQWRLLIRKTVR